MATILLAVVALSLILTRCDCVCLAPQNGSISIAIQADVIIANASRYMIAAGIEDVNHELIGGIDESLVFGESFEEPAGPSGVSGDAGRVTWRPTSAPEGACNFSVAVGDAQTGLQSQAILSTGSHACGVLNAGLDAAGMAFVGGKPYTGYVFAKVPPEMATGDCSVSISLVDTGAGDGTATVLATAAFNVTAGAGWTALNFTLTPSRGTACIQDPAPLVPCVATPEGVCLSCGGALLVSLLPAGAPAPAAVLLDEAVLAPGPWGAVLGSRLDVARALTGLAGTSDVPPGDVSTGLGLTAIRLGGSMILADGYKWKAFRGPRWLRDPYAGFWYPYTSSGWGMFEFLALCDAAGTELCVVTMNSGETETDVDNFIEYVFGDATTQWGALRASDGHLAPYTPFMIEIGNEQDHTDPAFINQVYSLAAVIAAAAGRLALPFRPMVAIGGTPGLGWPPSSVGAMVAALAPLTAALDFHWDFHVGGDAPLVDPPAAYSFIAAVQAEFAFLGSPIRGVVLEENGGRHDMQRALGRAAMSNRMYCLGDFIRVDSAANGLQILGRNDNGWDQGQLFMTPNGSYLAPHGFADTVLAEGARAGMTAVVAVAAAGLASAPGVDVIAVSNGTVLQLRAVNPTGNQYAADVTLAGCTPVGAPRTVSITTLAGPPGSQNSPGDPFAFAPVTGSAVLPPNGSTTLVLQPFSLTTATVACATSPAFRTIRSERSRGGGAGAEPTTCDPPGAATTPQPGRPRTVSFSSMGYGWEAGFNGGPWAHSATELTLCCSPGAGNCFDQAMAASGAPPLPVEGAYTVRVNVTFPEGQAGGTDDAFDGYEVSLQYGRGAMLGVHWLPSNFVELSHAPGLNLTLGTAYELAVNVAAAGAAVNFTVLVDGVQVLAYSDSVYGSRVRGVSAGVRAFYDDAVWAGFALELA